MEIATKHDAFQVPFPAVSIYNTPTVKGNDPWTDFATGVLDNVLFDCAGRDESCDEATQKVRDLLDKWIRYGTNWTMNIVKLFTTSLLQKSSD